MNSIYYKEEEENEEAAGRRTVGIDRLINL